MSAENERPSSSTWLLFLAGPVVWAIHFMSVYLLVEAACAAGADREVAGLHVLSVATLAATAGAVFLTSFTSARAYSQWRGGTGAAGDWLDITDRNPGLAFAGFLLGIVSIAAISFVGIPAAFLEPC